MSPCLIIITLFISDVISEESWVVNTEYGDVRGYWSKEHQVWEFLGIPYAAPPVGDLRFKAPVPPEPWKDVFNATEIKHVCMQPKDKSEGYESEDCLIINVYVPDSARNGNTLSVLHFTHGGGFYYGSSKKYNPYYTTRHNVILVTFNYRVGLFGYLCLGTEVAPGNAAIKDQIATLRWTNKNIGNFGGDPNSVTVYGESSGAGHVEAAIFSPMANGLFQRAILESGSALLAWAFRGNRIGVAKATALNLGCHNVDDKEKVGECLMRASAADINEYASYYKQSFCIENELDGVERAVIENPVETILSGNYSMVPILYAFTELEGASFTSEFESYMESFLNNSYENHILPYNIDLSPEETFEVNNGFKRLYFNSSIGTNESMHEFLIYYTDQKYINGIYRAALHNVKNGNTVYLLKYAYNGGFNQDTYYAKVFDTASHADIVSNIMDLGVYNPKTLSEDQVIRDRMTKIWTNFVKFGYPLKPDNEMGVNWQPFNERNQDYLLMDDEFSINTVKDLQSERMLYWLDLYKKHYYPAPVFDKNECVLNET